MITKKSKILILFSIFIFCVFLVKNTLFPNSNVNATDLTIENILNAINQERIANNLTTLNADTRLSNSAQYKSNDMQNRHYFSHTDPEGNYIWNKVKEEGYTPYLQLGENLAIEFFSTESLISAWMNSPTHRANILTDGFKDQGVGLNFGTPNQNQYSSAITNIFGTLITTKKQEPIVKKTTKITTPKVNTKIKPKTTTAKTPPKPLSAQTEIFITEPNQELPTTNPKTLLTEDLKENIIKPPPLEPFRDKQLAQNFSLSQQLDQNLKTDIQIEITKQKERPEFNPIIEKVNKPQNPLNRTTLILFIGSILLIYSLNDLKDFFDKKLNHLDKKINNIFLLILSLITIAFIYFF